jgi:hypothetical protein
VCHGIGSSNTTHGRHIYQIEYSAEMGLNIIGINLRSCGGLVQIPCIEEMPLLLKGLFRTTHLL